MKKLLLVSTILLSGCGNPTATVEGIVTYNKTPLPTGEIHFHGADGKSRSSPIGSDGSYKIIDCPTGTVKVAVTALKLKAIPTTSQSTEIKENDPDPPPPEFISVIPMRYGDKDNSGLVFTIKRGRQTIGIDVKD